MKSLIRPMALAMAMLWAMLLLGQNAWAENLKIDSVKENGTKIYLSDGSVWEVYNPGDWDVAYQWLPYQDVQVMAGGRELLNEHRGERVDVKQLKEPSSPAAAAPAAPAASAPAAPRASASASGAAPSRAPAASAPSVDDAMLKTILKRLDNLDAKMQVMDWRMRQIEQRLMVKP